MNNKKPQQVYSGKTSYRAYVVEIQEINLWSGKVLQDAHPPYPPKYPEEEKEDGTRQANAPRYPEMLVKPK